MPRLGVLTQRDANGVVVANVVRRCGSAAAAGVQTQGDYLVSVGDIPVEDQQFGAKMRAKYGASAEGVADSRSRCDAAATCSRLPGKLQFGAGRHRGRAKSSATQKAVRIRDGILKGRTTEEDAG